MTLNFFSPLSGKQTDHERYYISQFNEDTYQIIDLIENREICVCSNYDDWQDAEERAKSIVKLLNANVSGNKNTEQ